MGTVRAILTNTVGVVEGAVWDADDPLVRMHPEWFEAASGVGKDEVVKSSQGSGGPLAEADKAPPLEHRDTAPLSPEGFEAAADAERERIKGSAPAGERQVPATGAPPVEQATAAPGEQRSTRRGGKA